MTKPLFSTRLSFRLPASSAIEQRIWSAQVGVLFPYVETRRRELLARLRRRLVIPFEAADGRIVREYEDLELSHITAQVRRSPDARDPAWLLGTLDRLVAVRNSIAHFEPVPAAILHDPRSIDVTATDALLPRSGPDRIEGDGSSHAGQWGVPLTSRIGSLPRESVERTSGLLPFAWLTEAVDRHPDV